MNLVPGAALLAAFVLCVSCMRSAGVVDEPTWVRVAGAEDTGTSCADVHEARACWGAGDRLARVARPTPGRGEAWRCAGDHEGRACRRRRGATGAFVCEGDRCTQEHARLPDDGDWECFERDGAVVCRGGEPSAGVVRGSRDEVWFCGEVSDGGMGGRVCVDLAPDRPAPAFSACSYQPVSGGARQVCLRGAPPALGRACARAEDCPPGARCAGGACLPSRAPRPSCWLDADCARGPCLFGTCAEVP